MIGIYDGCHYLGFRYYADEEVEYDLDGAGENRKIYHEVHWPGPDNRVTAGPWSPYVRPTWEQFSSFVDRLIEDHT